MELGIIYVLSNPAMPGLVKIGKTARGSVNIRLGELYSTGVPVPFECEFAGRIADESKVERAFHLAFGPYRINPKREFFQIEPEQAIALLELMVSEDVTPQVAKEADEVDVESKPAANKLKKQRPKQNFVEMGLDIGAEIHFIPFEAVCSIESESKVRYEDQVMSLTALTKQLLQSDRPVRPAPHWTYMGRKLSAIYDETYSLK
ncbi:MAG: GIY-YIG nuclease family protein [Gammaproteobacteria bacterium]|nr:GIY-YIG nuclease family protein [Gammaproteobacteria bacterium]